VALRPHGLYPVDTWWPCVHTVCILWILGGPASTWSVSCGYLVAISSRVKQTNTSTSPKAKQVWCCTSTPTHVSEQHLRQNLNCLRYVPQFLTFKFITPVEADLYSPIPLSLPPSCWNCSGCPHVSPPSVAVHNTILQHTWHTQQYISFAQNMTEITAAL